MAELADAADSKSAEVHPSWGFNSPSRHHQTNDAKGLTRFPFRRVKTKSPAALPETQAFRSAKTVLVIKTSRPSPFLVVPGSSRITLLGKVDLVDLHISQFGDSPAIGPSAFDDASKPKLWAVRHDLAVLTDMIWLSISVLCSRHIGYLLGRPIIPKMPKTSGKDSFNLNSIFRPLGKRSSLGPVGVPNT